MFIDDKGEEKRGIKVNVLLLQGHQVDCKGKNSSLSKYSLRVCSHTPAAKRVKCFSPRGAWKANGSNGNKGNEERENIGRERKKGKPIDRKRKKKTERKERNSQRSKKEKEKQGMGK